MLYADVPPEQRITEAWLREMHPKATAAWVAGRLTGHGCVGAVPERIPGQTQVRYGRCKVRPVNGEAGCWRHMDRGRRHALLTVRAHATVARQIAVFERRRRVALADIERLRQHIEKYEHRLDRLYAEQRGQQRLPV